MLEEADRGDRAGRRSALRGVLRAQAGALDRLLAAVTREYSEELRRAAGSPGQRRAERVQALLLDTALPSRSSGRSSTTSSIAGISA